MRSRSVARPWLGTAALAASVLLAAASLAGCAGQSAGGADAPQGSAHVAVDAKTGEVTEPSVVLRAGGELTVVFDDVNGSVGESWMLVAAPDPAVLSAGEESSRYLGEEGSVGGTSEVTYRFDALGAGTTTLEFEYQFRGEPPASVDERRQTRIEVTVQWAPHRVSLAALDMIQACLVD